MNDTMDPRSDRAIAEADVGEYDVLIVDGGGSAVTAWAASRDLEHAEDRIRSAAHIFIASLTATGRLMRRGCAVLVAWDGADNRAYRRGMHPWYKHGRGSVINREEVAIVVNCLNDLLHGIGVDTCRRDGCEADDIVATWASLLASQQKRVLVFSDDKDYYQLIDTHIHLHRRSMNGIVITPNQARVLNIYYGDRYLFVKAIMGDAGDNIKGLRGIGETKAKAALDANPLLVIQCLDGPNSVDWAPITGTLRAAFIRAGRRLVWPPLMNDAQFATKFAYTHMLPIPREYDVSDETCLAAVAAEIAWSARMVTMNRNMTTPLMHGTPDNKTVDRALHMLGVHNDEDVRSSIDSLSALVRGKRDSDAAPDAEF